MQEAGKEAEQADDGEGEGGEPDDQFHSLQHVMPYAREAARALDSVQAAAERGTQRRRRLGSSAVVMHRCSCPSASSVSCAAPGLLLNAKRVAL